MHFSSKTMVLFISLFFSTLITPVFAQMSAAPQPHKTDTTSTLKKEVKQKKPKQKNILKMLFYLTLLLNPAGSIYALPAATPTPTYALTTLTPTECHFQVLNNYHSPQIKGVTKPKTCTPVSVHSLYDEGIYVAHASQVYVVKTSCDTKTIFKPSLDVKYGNYRYEIAASIIDEMFGFKAVPHTEEATVSIKGVATIGSMQDFVPNAKGVDCNSASFSSCISPNIRVLDIILGNGDRHRDNILQSDGKQFAIDNNKSFHPFDKGPDFIQKLVDRFMATPQEAVVEPQVFKQVLKVTYAEFFSKLKPWVEEKYIQQAWERLEIYKNTVGPKYYNYKPIPLIDGKSQEILLHQLENNEISTIQLLSTFSEVDTTQSQSGQGMRVVQLQNGPKAIFKYDTAHGVGTYRREIAAARLAQLLGATFVPPTIEKTLTVGGEEVTGSLQYFVPNMHLVHPDKTHYRDFDHPADAKFFDFLIGQYKRHNGNILFDKFEDTFYLIDNSNNFHKKEQHRQLLQTLSSNPAYFRPETAKLYENLSHLSNEQIREAVTGFLKDAEIQQLLERKALLLKALGPSVGK